MSYSIDINCDMGEEMPNDALIMPFISSANIACGAHAGNDSSMRETVELALRHGVSIGAHPSYPDRENFGRTTLYFPADDIYTMVLRQLETLGQVASLYHVALHHVKPHGALYNMASKDLSIALAITKAIRAFDRHLVVYGMGEIITAARSLSLHSCYEVFADRTYQEDGFLTPRQQPDAMLTDRKAVNKHVVQMMVEKSITTTTGKSIPVSPGTICIHGDGEHAVEFAALIHDLLISQHINITAP